MTPEKVTWLEYPYVPRGKGVAYTGDSGVGKSTTLLSMASNATRGLPLIPSAITGNAHMTTEPGNVLVLCGEDGIADTIRPRVDAAGGDPGRVYVFDAIMTADNNGNVKEYAVNLSDREAVAYAIQDSDAKLMIVDPIQEFLGADVDLHRANEVRPILAGVLKIAEMFGTTVIFVRHAAKSNSGKALYRGLGTVDITAIVRSELIAVEHKGAYAIAHSKSSLAPKGRTLLYQLANNTVEWLGTTPETADELVAASMRPLTSTRDDAQDFLEDMLSAGEIAAADVFAEAARAGITKRTLQRAKEELGVHSRRVGEPGGGGRWLWSLKALGNLAPLSRKGVQDVPYQDTEGGI